MLQASDQGKTATQAAPLSLAWACRLAQCVLLLCSLNAGAQPLHDPMRPPFADAAPAAGADSTIAPSVSSGLRLVKASRARNETIIDGRTVRVGEKVGDATLREVTDSSAMLVGPDGERTTLRLYPDADKKMISRARDAVADKKGRQ